MYVESFCKVGIEDINLNTPVNVLRKYVNQILKICVDIAIRSKALLSVTKKKFCKYGSMEYGFKQLT